MVKSAVKVYVRCRPTEQNDEGFKVKDNSEIAVKLTKDESAGLVNNKLVDFNFKASDGLVPWSPCYIATSLIVCILESSNQNVCLPS
eukprot:gene26432-17532_t